MATQSPRSFHKMSPTVFTYNSESMNISQVQTLAQIILSLSEEEKHLLQQQLAWRPQSSRTRRQVSLVETGDSFDACVADIAAESFPPQQDSKGFPISSESEVQSECSSIDCGTRSVEERSQKSLSIFRECLPS